MFGHRVCARIPINIEDPLNTLKRPNKTHKLKLNKQCLLTSAKWRFSQNPPEKPVVSQWLKVSKFRTSPPLPLRPCASSASQTSARGSVVRSNTPANSLTSIRRGLHRPSFGNHWPRTKFQIYGRTELCTIALRDKTENGIWNAHLVLRDLF